MLALKKRQHFSQAEAEKELSLLRDENLRLKDSLVLQTSVLEKEKKEK